MELSFAQICSITCGADRVSYQDGAYRFYRFTPEQEELYKREKGEWYPKVLHTSGVKLRFCTNSNTMHLCVETSCAFSRWYYSFDVLVNGKMIGALRNFRDEEMEKNYTGIRIPQYPQEGVFDLGCGEKEICIYLPWSCAGAIRNISLEDGSFLKPVKWKKRLVAFGDSITHGYDARYPHNKYISRLSEALDAQEHNKAIGGEVFFPELAQLREPFDPEYIVVAYGTNDWSKTSDETLRINSRAFYKTLSENYPDAKIFAITPIWRAEWDQLRNGKNFENAEKRIREATEDLDNVYLISGIDLVPHDASMFGDSHLHPSDEGFAYYYQRLYDMVKAHLS